MGRSFIYICPLWLRLSLVILIGVAIGIFIAGESTRKLDSRYLDDNIREQYQDKTNIFARSLTEAVISNDDGATKRVIDNFVNDWKNLTYVHVQDDRGMLMAEWRKGGELFGPGILKFEAPVSTGGGIDFGILSVYVDMNGFYNDMGNHIAEMRGRSGLILLTTALFITALVNLMVFEKQKEEKQRDE